MAKKAGNREKVRMNSSVSDFFYTTYRNKKNMTGKLEIMKYDPVVRRHVLFKESKI